MNKRKNNKIKLPNSIIIASSLKENAIIYQGANPIFIDSEKEI